LLEKDNTISLIKKINPDWVIHCAAATDVDWCEKEKEAAWNVNVEATRNVVDGCIQANSGIIYISTSFVFDGSKDAYYEDDEPNPINNYGITKLEGENLVKTSGVPFIIARTDQLYGWTNHPKNFVVKILNGLREKNSIEVFTDWYNNPTLIDNMSEVLLKLLDKGYLGTYHITGSSFINRYDWAVRIAEAFGLDSSLLVPINSSKYNPVATRPKVHMDNSKAQKDSGLKLFTIDEGLEFMKNHMEESV
jgi:dTDP-4-dehydrorhamnose reductase